MIKVKDINKVKILFVANTNSLYGANRSMLNLIKYLQEAGHKIWVMLPRNGGVTSELDKLGCPYFVENYYSCVSVNNKFNWRYFINYFSLPKIYYKIKKINIDIVHTNSSTHDIGAILAELLHVPHVWHVREIFKHYDMKYIMPNNYRRLREKSKKVICISRTVFDVNAKEFDSSNMVVVYNGFLVDEKNQSKVRFENPKIHLLAAGMITPNKGQNEAIEAMNVLINEKHFKNLFLTIVGDGEKLYIKELQEKVELYNLNNYIEFKAFDRNLSKLRENYDIALQCSRLEGLGRVTVESMLESLLVIGAKSGATQELISDKKNGFLYTPGNARELAEKIEYAILHKQECNRIINDAREWASNVFDNNKIGKMIEEEYYKICQ